MECIWLFELIHSQGNSFTDSPSWNYPWLSCASICPLCPHSRKILKKRNKNLALPPFPGPPWVTRVVSCRHLVFIELVWITSPRNMKLLLKSTSICIPLVMLLEIVGWNPSPALFRVLPVDDPRQLQEDGPAALVCSQKPGFSWTASGMSDFSQDRHLSIYLDSAAAWLAFHYHTAG